ncbi:OX-2 membrane glycoprotein-like [Hipposideros larvatus]
MTFPTTQHVLPTVPTLRAIFNDAALREQCVVDAIWMECKTKHSFKICTAFESGLDACFVSSDCFYSWLLTCLVIVLLKSRHGTLDSLHKIKHKNKETAVLGENVTIFCNLTTPADVLQITWQKIQHSLLQNIGTYSSKYGEKILPPYIDRVHCKLIEPNSSFITIREVTFEDEACYKCVFHVFPHGSHGGQICLNIIIFVCLFIFPSAVSELKTELQSNLSCEDFLRFSFSAVGKPAPQISLSPSQVLINPPEEYLAHNSNGTVTITKIYNISLEAVRSLRLQHLTVHVHHPLENEEKIIPLPVRQECK